MRKLWGLLGKVSLTLLVACSAAGDDVVLDPTSAPPPPPAGTAPVPAPGVSDTTISEVVGPEGGAVSHPSGAQILVPEGALAEPTRIWIRPIDPPSTEILAARPVGRGLEAGPDGQRFARPVVIILPIADVAEADRAQVRMAPNGSLAFETVDATLDRAERALRVSTLHFTQFIPAVDPNAVFITTPTPLPQRTVGIDTTASFAATGGASPYTWSLSQAGTLPAGLTLAPQGSLSGTATVAGSSSFFVKVVDTAGHAVQKVFELDVVEAPRPVPTVASVAPASLPTTTIDTQISVFGTDFDPASSVEIDAQGLSTMYVSPNELHAVVPASYLGTYRTLNIGVFTPSPGGGFSATKVPVVVGTPPPAANVTLTALSPRSAKVGTSVTLTLTGTEFLAGGSVMFGTTALTATVTSSTSASVVVPAALLTAAPQSVNVAFKNPPPGNETSPSLLFFVSSEAPGTCPLPYRGVACGPTNSSCSRDLGCENLGGTMVRRTVYCSCQGPTGGAGTWEMCNVSNSPCN